MPVGKLLANCYLVALDGADEAVVIDPGGDVEKILAVAAEHNVKVAAILNTHGHWDHAGADTTLSEATGAEVYVHQDDVVMLEEPMRNLSSVVGAERFSAQPDKILADGESIMVAGLNIKVIHTPGHTPGSSSFLIGENLFSGDLIFYESVGRTDLPGSDEDSLYESIRSKILTLPDETNIYPGHGPKTSVRWEREHNPYINGGW